ncbi:MAG: NAD/FAD-utilizing enzyme [Porticoccaceae bacterium]|jgi:hypothetical protein
MERYYYISDNLDELEVIERELENAGIANEQIHVLSHDDDAVVRRRLHGVTSIMKKDLIRSTIVGAVVGVCLAILVLVGAHLLGWTESFTWAPFIFLAVVLLGFCTWEGGLWGIQEPNRNFRRFHKVLKHGKHVLFVDIDEREKAALERVSRAHPRVKNVGSGIPAPRMVVKGHQMFRRFMHWAP